MLRVLVVSFGLIIAANPGRADQRQDCAKLSDDAAISACDQAIGQNLRDAHLYYYRGKAYSAKCEYDRTIADYKKVIELNLMKDPIGCHRGNVYSYRGAYDRAFADYNKAIELNPKYASALCSRL